MAHIYKEWWKTRRRKAVNRLPRYIILGVGPGED